MHPAGCLVLSTMKCPFAKIYNIATGSDSLLAKITKKCFRKLSIIRKIMERKWHKVFARDVLLRRFEEITLNYFSEAFHCLFSDKIDLNQDMLLL